MFRNTRKTSSAVEVADGNILQINTMGEIVIQLPRRSKLTLTNVLYVPGLKVNLISTAVLREKNIGFHSPASKTPYFEYYEQHVDYVDVVRRQYLLRTEVQKAMNLRDEGQLISKVSCGQAFKVTKRTTDIKIWHRRLVHLGYNNVLLNSKQVIDMEVRGPVPENACESCMKAKQQRESFRKPQSKADTFLGRIHVDIQGPLPTTFRGKRYFLLIKNDASGMFFVYTMRTKDEILPIFKAFKTWIEKQTGKQIKRIRAGGELRSNAFDDWFEEIGIQWEPSAPDTPEQNGVIERGMYIIVGSIRVVHKTYSVPMRLWDFTIEEIVYTWNRIATTSSCRPGVTPFEVINGVKPDVSNLRALGCRCYVHVLNTIGRHKFDDRSWKGVLVGYESHNQWKIYNPLNKKVHTSRDVRFDEKGSYYEADSSPPQCIIEEPEEEEEMGQIWTESEDEEMGEAQRPPTASEDKYFTSSDTKNAADTDEKKEFEDTNERQLTSEQQEELIPREIMSSPPQSTPSRTVSTEEPVSTEQTDASGPSAPIKKQ